ncbi:DUF2812 domain-containing protein [[Clostridium] fimetarium]|uniref:DUF2812 domain-containing protein n=1 Tax=[Clostridium] fimetarium TaxID=99656 RepID=A0A1I0P7N3_9FIRM|nr:DUF2812 domain-containing protein [[Clostridium] fimetarium]SEW10240.1 Protein of unknown function [[Clostridium] fimetarium]
MRNDNILKKQVRMMPDNLEATKKELEDLAARGWMLVEKEGNKFVFKKIEGKTLNFAVEIFDKASNYDTFPNEHNMEYIEFCEKAGWNFICAAGKIQIFYSEDLNLTPIETDDNMKFDVICKMSRTTLWIGSVLLPIIGFLNLVMSITVNRNSVELSFAALSTVVIWLLCILMAMTRTIRWVLWKKRCKKSVELGDGIIPRKYMTIKAGYFMIGTIFGIWSVGGLVAWIMLGQLEAAGIGFLWLVVLAMFPLINGISKIAQKKKLKSSDNAIAQFVIPFVFLLFFIVIWSMFIISGMNRKATNENEIPLTLSAIGIETNIEANIEANGNENNTDHNNDGKFLMSLDYYSESSRAGATDDREIKYYIYRTDFPIIYNRLMKDAKTGVFRTYGIMYDFDLATSVEGLKADKAWYYEENGHHYLFEYDGMIIKLDSNFAFNKEQLKTADTIFDSLVK